MSFIGREDDLKTEFIQTVNLNKTGQTKDIDVLLEPVEIKLNGNLVHKGTIREWDNKEMITFLQSLKNNDQLNIE